MEYNDFVTLGSALPQCDDDEIQSRKPVTVHDQVVRDEQGRIRFHGAFTGGFSAGYFNSVDTKEGWVPKNFKSSRSSRNQNKSSQKPEDFMDQEDFGEFGIAPKKLFSSDKYQGSSKHSWKTPQENSLLSLFSNSDLQQCVAPAKITVGQKLLKKMGWKNADINTYSVPERDDVFGCPLPPSLVAKQLSKKSSSKSQSSVVSVINFSIQINQFGLGYKGLTPQLSKQTDYVPSKIKSRGIRGQGFGVGALEEEDDDIYAGDSASNYNTVLYMDEEEPVQIPSKPLMDRRERDAVDGFKKSSGTPVQVKVYRPPVISGDFIPNVGNSLTTTMQNSESESSKRKPVWVQPMSSFKRGEMLGETAQIRSVFDMISEKDRLRLDEVRRNYSLSKSEEPEKQLNADSTNNEITSSNDQHTTPSTEAITHFPSGDNKGVEAQHIATVTEWEKEQRRENSLKVDHFSRSVMMGRFTKASENDAPQEVKEKSAKEKAASQNMFGRLTREVVKWHPHKFLCVRFNVEDPYPESTITGIPVQKHSKLSIFDVLSRDALILKEPQPPTQSVETVSKDTTKSEGRTLDSKPLAILSKVDLRPSVDESERLNLIPADNCDIPEDEKHENKEQAAADQTNEIKDALPPSVDIFKAIFEDDDDDEESSDKEDEDKDLIQQSDKNGASETRPQNWFENINLADSLNVQSSNIDIVNWDNRHHREIHERSTTPDKKKQKKEKHKDKKHKHSHKSHKKSKKSKRARDDSVDDSEDASSQLSKTDKYLLSKLRCIS